MSSRVLACLVVLILAHTGCARRADLATDATFATRAENLVAPAGVADPAWTLVGNRVAVMARLASDTTGAAFVWSLDPATANWDPPIPLGPGFDPTRPIWSAGGVLFHSRDGRNGPVWLRAGAPRGIEVLALPKLPDGRAPAAAAAFGTGVFVATEDGHLYRIGTDRPSTWVAHGPAGDAGDAMMALAAQSNGERPHLYVLTRRPHGLVFRSYEPERRVWRELPAPPAELAAGAIAPVGIAHLHAFGAGDEPVRSGLRVFNTVTRVWTSAFPLPGEGRFVAATGAGTTICRALPVG